MKKILLILLAAAWASRAAEPEIRLEPHHNWLTPGGHPIQYVFTYKVPTLGPIVHVEYSTNLVDWMPAQTYLNDATMTNMTRLQVMSFNPARRAKFYRVRLSSDWSN